MMIEIALYQPEIPPNTGNIIRLCANTGAKLHLIAPLGFDWDNKRLRRAGLDYHEFAEIKHHENFNTFQQAHQYQKVWACTTKAKQHYHQATFQSNDVLLFGPESRGLPSNLLEQFADTQIKIPMLPASRSLNLSNAVAIILFEALRQLNFNFSRH